jgi:hypothetical protein
MGRVEGQVVPLDVPLTVRELSRGGFSCESTVPFPPGTAHHFRFTTPVGAMVTLDATAVHCRLTRADAEGHHAYISGFEFQSSEATDQAVAALIDTLSSVLSLE